MTPALGAIAIYLLLQFGLGLWVSRRISTESDYLVAGRRLGYSLATFSLFATWFGAETMVGAAGRAYRDGVALTSAEPFGYALCLFGMGAIFAAPLWRRKLTTLADLYRQRYSPAVERLAAVILIPSSILWAAAQLRAFGHVLVTSTDAIDLELAIAVATAFTIAYTTLGGLLADAMTDLIQGVMLLAGLLILGVVVTAEMGGPARFAEAVSEPGRLQVASPRGAPPLAILEAWAIPVVGSMVATELVGRIVAARDATVARRSSLAAGGIYLAAGLIPVMIGLAGPALLPRLEDPEQLLPALALTVLPTIAYAAFAGALVSAILSTVDSTLLVSSGLAEHNLIAPLLRVTDERMKVRIARWGVVLFGLAAYLLARRAEGVFELVEQASAFGSAGAVVTVCFGLFTRFGGARAAATSLIAGVVSYLGAVTTGWPYPFLLSLAAALAGYVAIASVDRRERRATLDLRG